LLLSFGQLRLHVHAAPAFLNPDALGEMVDLPEAKTAVAQDSSTDCLAVL